MVAYNFNAQQYDPQYEGGGGFPVGQGFVGKIVGSHQQPTKDGQGGLLVFDIMIIDGPHNGLVGIDRLNLHNKNQTTVDIANKQLSAYCHVTGQYVLNDTQQLHEKPFKFDVRPQKNNPEYTEIAAIYNLDGSKPGKQGQGGGQQQQNNNPPDQKPTQGQGDTQGGGSNNSGGNQGNNQNSGGNNNGQWGNNSSNNNGSNNNGGGNTGQGSQGVGGGQGASGGGQTDTGQGSQGVGGGQGASGGGGQWGGQGGGNNNGGGNAGNWNNR